MEDKYKEWKKMLIENRHKVGRVLSVMKNKLKKKEVQMMQVESQIGELEKQIKTQQEVYDLLEKYEQQKCGGGR